jgi:iron complex transport system ATP-binding protein
MTASAFLTARGLNVTLAGRLVLKDVSLALSSGHLVALVGPNGAGKTTLLRALAGLAPSDGAIEVGSAALSSLSLRERARRFAYLPQGHVVHWPLAARDIVALGRYPHGATDPARLTPKDTEAVLRAMQATDVVEFSERRVTELSGGERSRVALARVLAVEAPVILADEPTASLDPRHQFDVMKSLRASADKGVLVIVVTHDLGLAARFADTVLVLSDGRLVSQGAHGRGVPDQRLPRGISARGRDRPLGGNLEQHHAQGCWVSIPIDRRRSSCDARRHDCADARGRSAAHRLDERLHRSIANTAGRSGANPRSQPLLARQV